MDRDDERRNADDNDEMRSSSERDDILGLGGSPVPKMPGDPSASNDPESVRRRRERASGADDTSVSQESDRQGSGATGIDMGAGGQGTDLSGR